MAEEWKRRLEELQTAADDRPEDASAHLALGRWYAQAPCEAIDGAGYDERTLVEAAMDSFDRFLMQNVEVRSKVWLEEGGSPLMGAGRAALLRAVERTGSINAAAKELGMDYRRAWGLIDSMEKRLKFRLVIRRRGGSDRGTSLTDEGSRLLKLFETLERGSQDSIDRQFHRVFQHHSKETGHDE